VLTGLIGHWEALSKWRDINWFAKQFGHRTIPVEIGRHQGKKWTENTLTINDFMNDYLWPDAEAHMAMGSGGVARMPPDEKVGYIAQHTLFDQLPSLRKDFTTPPLCNMGPQGMIRVNAWLGTSGTVTPLHYDSYDNLLSQVIGYKYVRLYRESEREKLYINEMPEGDVTTSQNNISPVDIENPDLSLHPLFKDAVYTETVLGPGDILFIPQGVWHYVRSLSPSMSVNFWF